MLSLLSFVRDKDKNLEHYTINCHGRITINSHLIIISESEEKKRMVLLELNILASI